MLRILMCTWNSLLEEIAETPNTPDAGVSKRMRCVPATLLYIGHPTSSPPTVTFM